MATGPPYDVAAFYSMSVPSPPEPMSMLVAPDVRSTSVPVSRHAIGALTHPAAARGRIIVGGRGVMNAVAGVSQPENIPGTLVRLVRILILRHSCLQQLKQQPGCHALYADAAHG